MPQYIGIVGCSAEGAALCYRTICTEGAQLLGPHAHPEVSMHTPSLAHYVHCLNHGDLQGVGDLMLASAHKLAAAGADFVRPTERERLEINRSSSATPTRRCPRWTRRVSWHAPHCNARCGCSAECHMKNWPLALVNAE